MRFFAATFIATVMTGCVSVSWPPQRGGGVAETAPPERHEIVLAEAGEAEQQLLSKLEAMEGELNQHIGNGAMKYVPAETTLARLLTVRIRREIAGTLYSDASTDLIELNDRLSVIDRILAKHIEVTGDYET